MVQTETEADTRANRIDPVLAAAGWGLGGSKVHRETICPGRIQSGGKRKKGLSADYVCAVHWVADWTLEPVDAGLLDDGGGVRHERHPHLRRPSRAVGSIAGGLRSRAAGRRHHPG